MVQSAEDRMSRRAPARRTQQFGCGLLVIADSAVMVLATQDIGSAVTACSARGWKERLVEDPETGAAAQADGVSETRRAFCGARGDKPQRRPRDAGVRFETALSGQVDGSPTNVTKGRKRRKRRRGRKVFAHDALTQGRVDTAAAKADQPTAITSAKPELPVRNGWPNAAPAISQSREEPLFRGARSRNQ